MKKLLLGLIIIVSAVLLKQGMIFNSSEPDFQYPSNDVLDEAMALVNALCRERSNGYTDSIDYYHCMDTADAFEDLCKQRILSQIPENLTSVSAVNENKRRMQKCVVPSS
ncbi:hypothetical protein [Thalassotalea litorea]|uniref:hypothetical protein n=1 Tax=Thalassotalea litorea TaxID=2020715 RepID=UPI003735BDC2